MTQTSAAAALRKTPLPRKSRLGFPAWAALALLAIGLPVTFARGSLMPLYLNRSQDLPILVVLVVLLLTVERWTPALRLPRAQPSSAFLLGAGFLLVALLGWGTYAIMENYPVSRDESMVLFDMAVYAKGQLAAPLAAQWRDFAQALVPNFLLNYDHPIGLVSNYLPVNALLRLGFSWIADPVFFNPVLVLIGGVALFRIAKRALGQDSGAIWTTLLVYVLSAQMLANAMTAYAMTGHMALNLVWLAAFLHGGRRGNAIAIVTAFLAMGLHQFIFHPLFAGPFLIWRLREGNWRLVLGYAFAYMLMVCWWIAFPVIAAHYTGVAVHGRDNSSLMAKLLPLLLDRDPFTIPEMLLNLLRFVAWQNLALLPLLFAAIPLAWRDRGIAAPMLWGIAGLLLFVTIILPYQGHGWGYRYLHPFLGSFALLAGFGYRRLAAHDLRRAQGMVVILSLITLVFAIPLLLLRAHEFVAPQAELDRFIAQQKSDYVLVDTQWPKQTTDGRWSIDAADAIQNLPDLSNRPLRFGSLGMSPARIAELCRRGSVTLVTRAEMHRLHFAVNVPVVSPEFETKLAQARTAYPSCFHAARTAGAASREGASGT